MTSCAKCGESLDLDEAPDTGECPKCGGPLRDARDFLDQHEARGKALGELVGAANDTVGALHRKFIGTPDRFTDREDKN